MMFAYKRRYLKYRYLGRSLTARNRETNLRIEVEVAEEDHVLELLASS
jgi:hypothetical protein